MTQIIRNITSDYHVPATETDVLLRVTGNVAISACRASETSGNNIEIVVVSGSAGIGGGLPSDIIITGGSAKYNSNGVSWVSVYKTEAEGSENFDTINEKTSGAGVTVDGTLIKDGAISTALNGGTIMLPKADIVSGNVTPTMLNTPESTPVNAVAASKLLTIGTNPIDGATVAIGGVTYTFKTALSAGPTVANEVLIGLNVEGSIDNLVLAITAGAGIGTNYSEGTVVNTLATAVKASAATMTATNLIKGIIGNSTAIAETLADGSWAAGATFLSGGVNGTVGASNEIRQDASYLYICVAANTIADANWRRLSLGTAY